MGTTAENADVDGGGDKVVERESDARGGTDVFQRREVETRNGHGDRDGDDVTVTTIHQERESRVE